MGNSEVGHQNLGAGRIVDQEIVRLNKGLQDPDFVQNPVFAQLISTLHSTPGQPTLHLMGLLSDAGVHASLAHLLCLLQHCQRAGLQRVVTHVFTDGRDTPPHSASGFIQTLEAHIAQLGGLGALASVSGRYWAMDRDQRWERVQQAYACLTGACPHQARSAQEALAQHKAQPPQGLGDSDEFVLPTQIIGPHGAPLGLIRPQDAVLFFNFRGDRTRELTQAFVDPQFSHFKRDTWPNPYFVCLTAYQEGLCQRVLFPKPPKMQHTLGQWIAQHGIPQFRCAETEKYPHVTFFFNDYREEPFPLEDRCLVPSPRHVATYDLAPQMSAQGVTQKTLEAIESGRYGFILVNYANPDMVGHTGVMDAAIQATEVVDACTGQLLRAIDAAGGCALVTADHGNADQMYEPALHAPHTRHTLNPVTCTLYGAGLQGAHLRPTGRLADVAPTVLQLMGLAQPPEMTGRSLLHTGP
jgi:2,3-bisphosphoglycerate-independent phosphoglycerate mutase